MQAEFLRRLHLLDPNASAWLHGGEDGRVRPYTISTLRLGDGPPDGPATVEAGDVGWFRITAYQEAAAQLVLELTEHCRDWVIYGRGYHLEMRVERWALSPGAHPWAGTATLDDLTMAAGASALAPPIQLEFAGPTLFQVDEGVPGAWNGFLPVPLPHLVFGSLRDRLAAWRPDLGPVPGRAVLETLLRLGRYRLATQIVQLPSGPSVAFDGVCEYHVVPGTGAELNLWLHMFSVCALYTGVGSRTAAGLGMVRRVAVELFS